MQDYDNLTAECSRIRTVLNGYRPTYRPTDNWSVTADIGSGNGTALVIIDPERREIMGHRTDGSKAWTYEVYTTGQDIADTVTALLLAD